MEDKTEGYLQRENLFPASKSFAILNLISLSLFYSKM
jgi:hypothetical protein